MQANGTRIFVAGYKGFRSVVAENEAVRVETAPELGGKLVSLLYKPTGKEWLLDSGKRALRKPVYGSSFGEWDMSGWDECFPTIDACAVDGMELPDHGEVWSLPWQVKLSEQSVVCTVYGRKMPYSLKRTLTLPEERCVRLAYEVEHLGGLPFSFLWAAHPQFLVDEPTRILVPRTVGDLVCVYGEAKRNFKVPDNWAFGTETTGAGTKFYYNGTIPAGRSGLLGLNSHSHLIVSVPETAVPHWGVWIDQGKFNDRTTIALEPGIGYYDSLERAERNGTSVRLQAGETYRWSLDVWLGQGDWQENR